MSIWTNIKKRGFKDILNPKRVLLYLRSKSHKKRKYIKIPYEDVHAYCEQVIWRRYLCERCYAANECVHCGCKAREVMIEPSGTCSAGEFFEMKNSEDWEQEKKEQGINITAEILVK